MKNSEKQVKKEGEMSKEKRTGSSEQRAMRREKREVI